MRSRWLLSAAAVFAACGLFGAASAQQGQSDPPGDASTHARLSPGQTINGALSPAGDRDWYRVTMRTGQLYRITLNGASGSGALNDPLLRVVDAHGTELARNDDANGSLNSEIQYTPSRNGDVFVEARGFGDDATGAYVLAMQATRLPPDNAAASADTRATLSLGHPVHASLEYAGDIDWYRIRLEHGQTYRLALSGAEGNGSLGDPLLRVLDRNGNEVAVDDDGGEGLNSYLEFSPAVTGDYFVEARGFAGDATGAYVLSAVQGDVPGDASTDVAMSADGDQRQGSISPAGDHDWYRVNLTAGQSIRVALNGAEGEGGLGDPFLTIHGPDGAELASDDDGGDGLNSYLEFTAPSAGVYYLDAHGFSPEATGRYTISLTGGEIPATADGAEPLTPGPEGKASMINTAGDVDWFAVDMIEGRPYRFNVTGAEPDALADPKLTLFDSEGHQVAADDDGGSGANSYLTFIAPHSATYYAAVAAFDDHATGRYQIKVSDTDVPGNSGTDEALTADGDDRASTIDFAGDLDWYSVQLQTGVQYVITVSGDGEHPLPDPFLAVMNEQGEQITTDDDSGPGLDARLVFTPQSTGTFYLQASGLGGATGGYKIAISRQNSGEHQQH